MLECFDGLRKLAWSAKIHDLRPVSAPATVVTQTTTSHNSNGNSDTLNERAAGAAPVNTAADTADEPNTARDAPPSTKATLHLHTTHNIIGWQLIHTAHHQSTARIQEREGYKECATMESEFAEVAQRGGG